MAAADHSIQGHFLVELGGKDALLLKMTALRHGVVVLVVADPQSS